jgi:hypothetical protein
MGTAANRAVLVGIALAVGAWQSTGAAAAKPDAGIRVESGARVQEGLSMLGVYGPNDVSALKAMILSKAGETARLSDGKQIHVLMRAKPSWSVKTLRIKMAPGKYRFGVGDADLIVFRYLWRDLPVSTISYSSIDEAELADPSPNLHRPGEFHEFSSHPGGVAEVVSYWLPHSGNTASYSPKYVVERSAIVDEKSNRGTATGFETWRLSAIDQKGPTLATVTPLNSNGRPHGAKVPVRLEEFSRELSVLRVPVAYDAQTAKLQIDVSVSANTHATWVLDRIPRTKANFVAEQPRSEFRVRKVIVQGAAAVSTDSNAVDVHGQSAEVEGGIKQAKSPLNIDNHPFTGMETIRCFVRGNIHQPTGQFVISRVMPQWGTPITAAKDAEYGLAAFTRSKTQNDSEWVGADFLCGAVFRGQPQAVKIEGQFEPSGETWETVAFRDLTVNLSRRVSAPIALAHPQTITAASGLRLTIQKPAPFPVVPPFKSQRPPQAPPTSKQTVLRLILWVPGQIAAKAAPDDYADITVGSPVYARTRIHLSPSVGYVPIREAQGATDRKKRHGRNVQTKDQRRLVILIGNCLVSDLPGKLKNLSIEIHSKITRPGAKFTLLLPVEAKLPQTWNADHFDYIRPPGKRDWSWKGPLP